MTDPISFDSTTPRQGLPCLFPGQAQKEFYVNESLAKIDLLLHPVIENERAEPPTNPVEGHIYLIAAGASGAWAAREGQLAGWSSGQWLFLEPLSGMQVFDQSTGQVLIYRDGWQRPESPSLPEGGAVIDENLRTAFANLLVALQTAGIFSNT